MRSRAQSLSSIESRSQMVVDMITAKVRSGRLTFIVSVRGPRGQLSIF